MAADVGPTSRNLPFSSKTGPASLPGRGRRSSVLVDRDRVDGVMWPGRVSVGWLPRSPQVMMNFPFLSN